MKTKIIDILNIIKEKKKISVNEIAQITALSSTSIRRYLTRLENDELVIRTHGGVKLAHENEDVSVPVSYKNDVATNAKEKIAKYAASLMKDNTLVFLDSGSSMLPLAKYIRADVFVVTCNLSLAIELGKHDIKVFLLPGYVNARGESVYSKETYEFVSKMRFDQSFVSATAYSNEMGFTCNKYGYIKRECLMNGSEKYILCDSTKFKKSVASKIADLNECTLITNDLAGYIEENEHVIVTK